jgi:hydroxymethylpyrimidine pyrophosphatase-like HAD family hydrolase
MFEAFENSFAMAQAPEEVRQKAKIEVKGVYCIKDHL